MSDRQLTDQALIDQYFKLDKKADEIKKELEERLTPYKQGMMAIKGMLHERLNQRGAKHTSVDGGTAYKAETMSVKTTDKSAFLRFCISDPDWGMTLLTANVAKDGLSTFIEKHTLDNGTERVPPGIEVTYVETVQIRKT